MRKLLKNFLLLSRKIHFLRANTNVLIFASMFVSFLSNGQIANYVNNGSFEHVVTGSNPPLAKYWGAIDTMKFYGVLLSKSLPPYNVPLSAYAYQWPKKGSNYFISSIFYISNGTNSSRGYPRNRLKHSLKAGTRYCVKFHCNITNNSTHGVDGLGAYFGDSSIDTITKCNPPITYLVPQIQNPSGNLITDTLNWIPITGTFVANGTEKYMILGNFISDSTCDSVLINPSYLPQIFTDIFYDEISCIDIDLPAFAGRDTSIISGDSIFIGREPDAGIDEACMWYKMPTIITSTTIAIDTIAGFWIKPVTSCTYVVRQQLWCSSVKYDTVIIHINSVGLEKLKMINEELRIYPVPAKDHIELSVFNVEVIREFHSLYIYNAIGLLIREEEIKFDTGSLMITTDDLPSGVYSLQLKNNFNESVSKRFVISR
jgi:hypothetical protein